MNFALYMGHLGRREPVVQPATQRTDGSTVAGFVFGEEGRREGRALEDYDSNRAIICATCRARPRRRSPFAELPTAAERATRVQRGATKVRRDAAEVRRRS